MIYLGIDSSSKATAYCILSGDSVTTDVFKQSDKIPISTRIRNMADELESRLEYITPENTLVCIEYPFNIKGHAKRNLELIGAIKRVFKEFTVYEIPQSTLKKFATDKGGAEKSEMVMRAFKEFGVEADTEDEIDAFWVALALKMKIEQPDDMPKYRRERLISIEQTLGPNGPLRRAK